MAAQGSSRLSVVQGRRIKDPTRVTVRRKGPLTIDHRSAAEHLSKGGGALHRAGGGAYPMMVPLWLPPVVRAVLTALLVLTASVLANRLGPFWGGLVASLPVSAGPTYVFLAIDHDPGFVATSALASAPTNAATGLFLIVYGVLARS